jgi:hypothetical protein
MPQQKRGGDEVQDDGNYALKDGDYLKLWMYFQDKSISVKGAMFNTFTWLIGFAAALLAFIFANLTDYVSTKAVVSLTVLVNGVSTAGLVICLYAFVALYESNKRINDYWEYANNCSNKIAGLTDIVPLNELEKKPAFVCQLAGVVTLFFVAFIFIIVWVVKTL